MTRSRHLGGKRPMANLTPMIDVVFQLIIFFMLTAQFAQQQTLELDLPRLAADASDPIDPTGRTVINVVPVGHAEQQGGLYQLGTLAFVDSPDGVAELAEALIRIRQRQPEVRVLIRAARTEPYEHVHPALQAASLAGISDIELVVAPPIVSGRRQ